jgi:hypothetical protein
VWVFAAERCIKICGHFLIPGREEHECGCFLCADSSRVDGVSCCSEHYVFMVNGMADGEPRRTRGEGIVVYPEHFVPWVLTPVMGNLGSWSRRDAILSLVTRPGPTFKRQR